MCCLRQAGGFAHVFKALGNSDSESSPGEMSHSIPGQLGTHTTMHTHTYMLTHMHTHIHTNSHTFTPTPFLKAIPAQGKNV